jgi:hypothetical protein
MLNDHVYFWQACQLCPKNIATRYEFRPIFIVFLVKRLYRSQYFFRLHSASVQKIPYSPGDLLAIGTGKHSFNPHQEGPRPIGARSCPVLSCPFLSFPFLSFPDCELVRLELTLQRSMWTVGQLFLKPIDRNGFWTKLIHNYYSFVKVLLLMIFPFKTHRHSIFRHYLAKNNFIKNMIVKNMNLSK